MNLDNVRKVLDRWLVRYDGEAAPAGPSVSGVAQQIEVSYSTMYRWLKGEWPTDKVVVVDDIQWWFYFDHLDRLKAVDGWGRQVVITSATHLNYVAMLLAVRQAETVFYRLADECREDEWRATQ